MNPSDPADSCKQLQVLTGEGLTWAGKRPDPGWQPTQVHVNHPSEWFENWNMSIAQEVINTFHTDKQHLAHITSVTRVLKLKQASNAHCKSVLLCI